MSGILYLIPSPLGENDPKEVIPAGVLDLLPGLQYFVVEELRTVRRYLSKAGLKGKIGDLQLFELNEHTPPHQVEGYVQLLKDGNDVGLVSEAGLPAVADPGAYLVELAHKNGIEVRPMVGPSSLMLALMASGLNGQCFAFTGYLITPNFQAGYGVSLVRFYSNLGSGIHSHFNCNFLILCILF